MANKPNTWPCEHCGKVNPGDRVLCQDCGEHISSDKPDGAQATRPWSSTPYVAEGHWPSQRRPQE